MNIDNDFLIKHFDCIAETLLSASTAIKKHYAEDFDVQVKSDDTPLTKADLEASDIICNKLEKIFPYIPVISEENEKDFPFQKRKNLAFFWLVDPLDGTKHFVKKDGEFSINIALLENNKPVFGIIYSPILDIAYFGLKNCGSFKLKHFSQNPHISFAKKIHCSEPNNELIVSLGDKNSKKDKMNVLLSKISKHYNVKETFLGSSLKMCKIAEGKSHIYPRLGLTGEWDTAAATVILEEAGGSILKLDSFENLSYNKECFLNPHFVASSLSIDFLKELFNDQS